MSVSQSHKAQGEGAVAELGPYVNLEIERSKKKKKKKTD